jgi:hypothetical protein
MKRYADFQKYNVYRSPQWRWDRVMKMANRGPTPGRCSTRDDDYVRKARNFHLRWRDYDSREQREELYWETPGLFYAYEINEKQSEQYSVAAVLQARLLAGQPAAQIAEAMSTVPETVEWYEALFFNVNDRLKNRDWVTTRILLPALLKRREVDLADGAPFRDPPIAQPFMDGSLKMFAYFGGPRLVDFMITGFQAGKQLNSIEDLAGWLDGQWASTIRRRSAQAALMFNVNNFNVTELFTIHTRIMEIERSEESADLQKTTTERHIKAMLDEIPWAVGDKGADKFAGTLLGRLDNMPAELRDEEILKVTSGKPVPNLDVDWPDKLPAARAKPSALSARTSEF